MRVAVDIEQHGGNGSGAPVKEHVLSVRPVQPRREHHLATLGHLDSGDEHTVGVRVYRGIRAGIPPRRAWSGECLDRIRLTGTTRGSGSLAKISDRSMQLVEHLRRHRVDAIHQLPGALVSGPRFGLLLIGEGHRAQRENLIDLGAIEQVAGTFRCNRWIVVKNDRRDQENVPASWFADHYWPGAFVATALDG